MKKIYTIAILLFVIALQGQNKLLSSIQESYYNGSWYNANATNYEYDSNNNLISETNLEWDQVSSIWKIKEKVTYTYNTSDKVIQELGQVWNATTNSFENDYRDTYTYTNGKITEQIAELPDGLQWTNDYKLSITYNVNGLVDGALEYTWNGANWINDYRTTLTYNANNKITTDLYEKWVNSQWVNSDKAFFTYNDNNKIVNENRSLWDDSNNLWLQDYINEYQMDASGNRTISTHYSSDYQYKDTFTYDTSILMANLAHPFKDKTGLDYILEDFPYINKVLVNYTSNYNKLTSTYEDSSRTTYNYNSAITLDIDQHKITNTTITLFPNPTSLVLNLNFSEAVTIDKVVVVDITGKTVLHQNQNSSQINVEKLAKGLYIIEAYSGNKKLTSKFVKE